MAKNERYFPNRFQERFERKVFPHFELLLLINFVFTRDFEQFVLFSFKKSVELTVKLTAGEQLRQNEPLLHQLEHLEAVRNEKRILKRKHTTESEIRNPGDRRNAISPNLRQRVIG